MAGNDFQPLTSVMESLRPLNLELKAECTGDARMPVKIHVIVEAHAEQRSSLTILKKIDELCSRDSLSWNVFHVGGQGDVKEPEDMFDPDGVFVNRDNTVKESDGEDVDLPPTLSSSFSRPSKIPIRKLGVDGASDDDDDDDDNDLPESDSLPENEDVFRGPTFDDFDIDLPPSPSPSSQDLIPWTSTKDILNASPEKGSYTSSVWGSDLRHKDGNLVLFISGQGKKGVHRVEVTFDYFFTKNQDDWFMLDLSDIIAACPSIPGEIVLCLPHESQFEHVISGIDNIIEFEGCFHSCFDPRDRPFVFFQVRERKNIDKNEVFSIPIDDTKGVEEDRQTVIADDDDNDDGHDGEGAQEHGLEPPASGRMQESVNVTNAEQTEEGKEAPSKASHQSAASSARTLRQKVVFTLQWFLPTLFLFTCIICTIMGGPPEAVATPLDTFRTVSNYANHLGHAMFQTPRGNVSSGGLYQYLHNMGLLDQSGSNLSQAVTPSNESDLNEDFKTQENTSVEEIIDEASEQQNETNDDQDSTKCFLPLISHREKNKWNMCPSDLVFEEETPTPDTNEPSSKALLQPVLETDQSAVQQTDENDTPSPFSPSHFSSILSTARNIFRHVACSTSTACTIASVSTYKRPTWEVFERYYCGENGDWSPTTLRDRFDYLLGWTPPECWENE